MNKRFLNAVQSSQWKVVPRPDESDDVQVVQNPTDRENSPGKQDFRHRLLRDATAFYRNDTSHFLGELQEAESLLYQKVNLVSKIDFLPPKRKTSPHKDWQESQALGFDKQLSDTDSEIDFVQRIERKKHKNDEPEKLIVDVNDFIDTFSVLREPVYHRINKTKPDDFDKKSEYDFLLNQVPPLREMGGDGETPGLVADFVEQLPSDYVVKNVKPICEPSITRQDVLPFVDDPIMIYGEIHHQTHFAMGTVEDVCPCHSEIPQHISESNQEQEPSTCLNETKVSELRPAPEKMESREHVNPVHSLRENTMVVENQIGDAGINDDEPSDDGNNDVSTSVVAQLPEILEHLGKFAGDQCESLADYIKDKVYDGSRLIAFCGLKRGVGCSTMTLLAARGIMRHGLKTAVIDANFEFPNLNALITGQQQNKQQAEESWVNILHGTVTWETLGMTPKDMPLFTVFPLAENALVNWSQYEPERLQQETNRFVSTLQEYFDLILLDCGCFEAACEEITWGELALFQPDGVILVRNPKETPAELLEPCCREILNGGIGAFGVAENFV